MYRYKIKSILVLLLLISIFTFSDGMAMVEEDKYDQMVREISATAENLTNKKIAIIPFSYADGREATKDGTVIAERLAMKIIKLQKFEVIERNVLGKIMNELKLQASGIVDATSTKELGKILGVEAIITGTLVETADGRIEVNARLIKTETAQAIGASTIIVEKDWIGDKSEQTHPPAPATLPPVQAEQPQQPQPQPYGKEKYNYGFFDLFLGLVGSPKINMELKNSGNNIYLSALGITTSGISNGPYRSVKWEELESGSFGPLACRVGGFFNEILGGEVEFSYQQCNIKSQSTTFKLNNGTPISFKFYDDKYLTVKSFNIAGALLLRYPGEIIDPYIGLGLGISFNSISMPYVSGYTNSTSYFSAPVDDFGIGFVYSIPIGMRIKIQERTHIITEMRYELNSFGFTRKINNEEDSISIEGYRFIIGMGFQF